MNGNAENLILKDDQSVDLSTKSLHPRGNIESVFEKFEMMSLQRSTLSGVDMKNFNAEQKSKLLTLVEKNEEHAFEYYRQLLESKTKIKLEKIKAGSFSIKTERIFIVAIIIVVFVVTLSILFSNQHQYFVPWLTFVTGTLGGFGVGRATAKTTPEVLS